MNGGKERERGKFSDCIHSHHEHCSQWNIPYEKSFCDKCNHFLSQKMPHKSRTSIRRGDCEKFLTAFKVLFKKIDLSKKTRVIIEYDPQKDNVTFDFFTLS